VTEDDLGRIVNKATGKNLTDTDKKNMLVATQNSKLIANGLSLSDFSKLFSGLEHEHYPSGHFIFQAGDVGDAMYFINSGKVEIKTRKGKLVHILRPGDFFGEESLLEEDRARFSSAKCASPTDVIKIDRADFERYIEKSPSAKNTLKFKWKARSWADAKNLIRLQTKIKSRTFKKGEVVYKEGDLGESMYFVDEIHGGLLEVKHGEIPVHDYRGGESFGESSLLFERPRS